MLVADYSVSKFNDVPDYWDVKEQAQIVEELAPQLGNIICRHGLQDVFGVTILHNHFKMGDSEKLVRRFASETCCLAIAEKNSADSTIPYIWKFDSSNRGMIPLEFCVLRYRDLDVYNAHASHMNRKQLFFNEFRERLQDLDAINLVGLFGLFANEPFSLNNNQTLMEDTFERDRYTKTTVREKFTRENYPSDVIKTLWTFHITEDEVMDAQCASHCYAHPISESHRG